MRFLLILFLLTAFELKAQEAPASANLLTLGPIDGESDEKSSVITLRYDTKPSFARPVVEAHGSFLQVVLPNTTVLKPGVFQEANSPYIRKFAAFQLDEDTAALRLFVSKEAENLAPAVSVDILENRVLIIVDHAKAEKALAQNFQGVPVKGGPSPQEVVKQTEVRSDIPDPISLMGASKTLDVAVGPQKPVSVTEATAPAIAEGKSSESVVDGAAAAQAAKASLKEKNPEVAAPKATDNLDTKLMVVTAFSALMLLVLIGLKSWRKVAAKTVPPGAELSLKTIATHALGPKQRITVIQVGNEQILLGVSPDSINFLTSLRPQAEAAANFRLPVDPNLYQKTLTPSPRRSALQDGAEPLQRPLAKEARVSRETKVASSGAEPGSSIRYGVGDEGIKNYKSNRATAKVESNDESLEDVTRLIRKKLKDLPKV